MNRIPAFNTISASLDRIKIADGHNFDNRFDLLASGGANVLGYNNPIFKQAVIDNYHRITSSFWTIDNDIWDEFGETLKSISAGRYTKYITGLTGSDAVDNAIKMMWMTHGKDGSVILVRRNSFHSGSISGWQMTLSNDVYKHWNKIKFVDFFDNLSDKIDEIGADNIAGVLIDTVSWCNGLHAETTEYWKDFQETIDKHNLILCVDEVLTGIGRMGCWLHSHTLNLKPNIITLGKAISAGHENLSVTMVDDRIEYALKDQWLGMGNTRSNNTVGALIATQAIKSIDLNYIKSNIIPYINRLSDICNKYGIRNKAEGTMLQAYPNNWEKVQHSLNNKLYIPASLPASQLFHLPFYDITFEEMILVEKVFNNSLRL